MIKSYTRSEQAAIKALINLMEERIIPFWPWEVMEATPIEIVERFGNEIERRERKISFRSFFYRVNMRLDSWEFKGYPLEGQETASWKPYMEIEVKTRPFKNYPWKTRYVLSEELRKIVAHRDDLLRDWRKLVEKNYEKFEIKEDKLE